MPLDDHVLHRVAPIYRESGRGQICFYYVVVVITDRRSGHGDVVLSLFLLLLLPLLLFLTDRRLGHADDVLSHFCCFCSLLRQY